jgi:hypothetical protein
MTVVGMIPKSSTPNLIQPTLNANVQSKKSPIDSKKQNKRLIESDGKETKSNSRFVGNFRPWQERLKRSNAATGLTLYASARKP